jgi:hypothetical protein
MGRAGMRALICPVRGSMRQTAAAGWRVSTHTQPSPVATEKGDPGNRIRATIASSFPGGVDDVLVELGGSVGLPVVQPDAATATDGWCWLAGGRNKPVGHAVGDEPPPLEC